MDQRLIARNQPAQRHYVRRDFSGVEGVQPRVRRASRRRRPGVEIVRIPEGTIEIKLSGLVEAAERRVRRWRAAALVILLGLVVGISVAVVVLTLRWDYQRGRALQLARSDLEMTQVRARCWEALARYSPKGPQDVIPDASRSEWVRQCVATELSRLNPKQ